MSTTYERAPAEIVDRVRTVMDMYHGHLSSYNVTIDVLLAYADENSTDSPVKAHGYPALAVVRKIGLKDRVKGCADAEIVLDGEKLPEWSDRELDALIDHELTHLELQYDSEGNVKKDDLDRPKLNIRLHDRQFGWFDSVARRWRDDSMEVKQAKGMAEDWNFVQLYLPNFEPSDLGRVKLELLNESTEADERNGETSSYVEDALVGAK